MDWLAFTIAIQDKIQARMRVMDLTVVDKWHVSIAFLGVDFSEPMRLRWLILLVGLERLDQGFEVGTDAVSEEGAYEFCGYGGMLGD